MTLVELREQIARKIYANVHHLMRVTGTDAQEAYEAAADSILALPELERLQQRVEVLEGALRGLVTKLDECQPHVANLSAMQFVRSGVQYTGPSYGEELEQARAALGKK